MPEMRKLVSDLISKRPELKEETLMMMIREKKSKVGGGYLTDQGALFLVASDLGVTLDYSETRDLKLKDIYLGATDVTVSGRILSIYPIKSYEKRDGSKGKLARLVIFDRDDFARVTLWDDRVDLAGSLSPDNPVRVLRGYVRGGLDGEPVLHVGGRGSLEVLREDSVQAIEIPRIEEKVLRPHEVNQVRRFLSIECITKGPTRYSEFTRSDGSKGSLLQFVVGDHQSSRDQRVAIWDRYDEDLLKLPTSSRILLLNVRSKVLERGEVEFHGDLGTTLRVLEVGRKIEAPPPKTNAAVEGKILSIGLPRMARSGTDSVQVLMIGRDYKLYTIIMVGEASEKIVMSGEGAMVEVEGRFLEELKIICDSASSLRSKENGSNLGNPLMTKIERLHDETIPVFSEVISLSSVTSNEVTTKDKEVIERAEIIVGDDTGEIRVTGWREDAKMLEGIQPGQRLRLKGLQLKKGRDGLLGLTIRPYSSIEKIG